MKFLHRETHANCTVFSIRVKGLGWALLLAVSNFPEIALAAKAFLQVSPTARIQYSTKPGLVPVPASFGEGYVFQDPSGQRDSTVILSRQTNASVETTLSVRRRWKSELQELSKQYTNVRDLGCHTLSYGLHRCDVDYALQDSKRNFAASFLFNRGKDDLLSIAESDESPVKTREILGWYKWRIKLAPSMPELRVRPSSGGMQRGGGK